MADKKYSLDYVEGYLEGIGIDLVGVDGSQKKYRKILDQCFKSELFDYGNREKSLDCICDKDFVQKYL